MIDIVNFPGGILKQCNGQLLRWLVSFELLELIGHAGYAIALEKSMHWPCIKHEGKVYKPTADTCPHDIIIIWPCNDAFLANKVEAKAGCISIVDPPFLRVQAGTMGQRQYFHVVDPSLPTPHLDWPGCDDVWEAPGFQPAIASVFMCLTDFDIVIVNPLQWYNTWISATHVISIIQFTMLNRQQRIWAI